MHCAECVGVQSAGGMSPHSDPRPVPSALQAKAAQSEQEARRLQLRSLQFLERYVYLVLFSAYLHLERAGSWQRPFSAWMREVRARSRGQAPCRAGTAPMSVLPAAEVVSRSALGPTQRLRSAGVSEGSGGRAAGWGRGWAPAPCVPEAVPLGASRPPLCLPSLPAAFQPWPWTRR